ncbi:Cytochrome c oxidase subunit 3, partial [Ophiophagus hannah]
MTNNYNKHRPKHHLNHHSNTLTHSMNMPRNQYPIHNPNHLKTTPPTSNRSCYQILSYTNYSLHNTTPRLLYRSNNNYCHPNRNQSIRLTSHPSRRPNQMRNSNLLSPRIHLLIHTLPSVRSLYLIEEVFDPITTTTRSRPPHGTTNRTPNPSCSYCTRRTTLMNNPITWCKSRCSTRTPKSTPTSYITKRGLLRTHINISPTILINTTRTSSSLHSSICVCTINYLISTRKHIMTHQLHQYHLVDPSPWPLTGAMGSLLLASGLAV